MEVSFNYHLTLKSTNEKTGPIPVSTTTRASCWQGCAMWDACYGAYGPVSLFWRDLTSGAKGVPFEQFLGSVAALPQGMLWRHNQAGDLPGLGARIDGGQLAALVAANSGRRGFTYTHKPVLDGQSAAAAANRAAIAEANAAGFTINLSGNNREHADALAELAIAPVVTVLPEEYGRKAKGKVWLETLEAYKARVRDLDWNTPAGRKVVACPATYLDHKSCANCALCAVQSRKVIVGFPLHGAGKKKGADVARGGAQ